MKKLVTMLFVLGIIASKAQAQSYGGSAYVQVKDKDGKARFINVVESCASKIVSEAKRKLESSLKAEMGYNEKFDGQVYYNIDQCGASDSRMYGGSASVTVKDNEGKTRDVDVTISCYDSSIFDAKRNLKNQLMLLMYRSEVPVTGINYTIESCSR